MDNNGEFHFTPNYVGDDPPLWAPDVVYVPTEFDEVNRLDSDEDFLTSSNSNGSGKGPRNDFDEPEGQCERATVSLDGEMGNSVCHLQELHSLSSEISETNVDLLNPTSPTGAVPTDGENDDLPHPQINVVSFLQTKENLHTESIVAAIDLGIGNPPETLQNDPEASNSITEEEEEIAQEQQLTELRTRNVSHVPNPYEDLITLFNPIAEIQQNDIEEDPQNSGENETVQDLELANAEMITFIDLGGVFIPETVLQEAMQIRDASLYEIAKHLFNHLFTDEECKFSSRSGRGANSREKLCPVKYVACLRTALKIKFAEGNRNAWEFDRTFNLVSPPERCDISTLNTQLGEHRNQKNRKRSGDNSTTTAGGMSRYHGWNIYRTEDVEWYPSRSIPMGVWATAHLHALQGKMAHAAKSILVSLFTHEELLTMMLRVTEPNWQPFDPMRVNATILITRWLLSNVQEDPYNFPRLNQNELEGQLSLSTKEKDEIMKKVFTQFANQYRLKHKRSSTDSDGEPPVRRSRRT